MRGTTQFILLATSLCFFFGGCASTQVPVVTEPEAFVEVLSTTDSRRVVLDTRKAEDFAAGHVRCAQSVDMSAWSKASREGAGLEDALAWSTIIGSLGINSESVVYVYDSGPMSNASRVWFILQHFGHKNTSVIDGGWKTLQPLLPGECVVTTSDPCAPTTFPAVAHAGKVGVTTRDQLKAHAAAGNAKILDVRSADEYTGKSKAAGARGGHVPTAANLPHKDFINENGRLRSPEEIRDILAREGVGPDDSVVLYCQSGGRASLAALAAKYAGYDNVSNYYMSMGEWLDDQSCPVE